MERLILDRAVLEALLVLAQKSLCPDPAQYELALEEGWERSVAHRRQDLKKWVMTKAHATCVSPDCDL
jgi:hypothetical protein